MRVAARPLNGPPLTRTDALGHQVGYEYDHARRLTALINENGARHTRKVRQHGDDRRQVWRKLHLAADSATHEIICTDLSLRGTTDAQALPGLINQTHRKIKEASADGAYDSRDCHDALLRKKSGHLSRPEVERNTGRANTMSVTTRWRISI
ncbi:hypothetical protein KU73_21910 [Pectobacterium wasabiae]|uniref:Transposase IS4-like domain-containing protein n=1 Tax=Pectobacterium wasabiae TaxID=55208 RepID=A0AAW3EFT2_9GAMM|nr:hypothetical protein JV38_22250 [Pectobacterium wasabiae]KGA26331.1 hypothetical protein KU73_21910 [Pectobacterium wasabiae]